MFPILAKFNFGFGVIEIKAYSFFLFLALLISVMGVLWYGKKSFNFSLGKNLIAVFVMVAFGIIGARGLNIFLNWGYYQKNPAMISSLDSRGFSLFGGILLGGLAGMILVRIYKLNLWRFSDMYTPFLGLGIVFLRVGCYLNGCCFGKETALPWGVVFPNFSQAHLYQLGQNSTSLFVVHAVHPTQLYELCGVFFGTILAFWLNQKKVRPGITTLSFLIVLCVVRLINLNFRVMPTSFDAPVYFYPIFYGLLICACIYYLCRLLGFAASKEDVNYEK